MNASPLSEVDHDAQTTVQNACPCRRTHVDQRPPFFRRQRPFSRATTRSEFENDGVASLYEVSIDWSPLVLNLPDGGAWGFFTAQLRLPTEPGANPLLSNRKLFATRFDPGTGTWQPAFALPGEVSFGPTGVVDGFRQRSISSTPFAVRSMPASFSTLVYLTVDDAGEWSQPAVIVANESSRASAQPRSDHRRRWRTASGMAGPAWRQRRAARGRPVQRRCLRERSQSGRHLDRAGAGQPAP